MKGWQFGTIAVLIVGLIGAVLYHAVVGRGDPPICPAHTVPFGPSHPERLCGYQHGSMAFVNELHEGDVTVTIGTGHEQGKFCDHWEETVAKTIHHAVVEIFENMALGPAEFTLNTDDGETYRGHVPVQARQQVRCGVTRGPDGTLTCDVTVEGHELEFGHD